MQATIKEVCFTDNRQPEEQGKLFLYPIEDNKYCLQLCYLLQGAKPGDNYTVCSLVFLPPFFDQYPPETLLANQPFRFDQTTEMEFPVCGQTSALIDQMRQTEGFSPFTLLLHQGQVTTSLLRKALECIVLPFQACQVPACRFLAYESEREKIMEACRILSQNLDRPHTIRELARKVAMNECYLKKGFKALTGKTVHDYQQDLRIDRAKELLQGDRLSVTDVAATLGYSSISHFSTAFKRVTGMKPCELLA